MTFTQQQQALLKDLFLAGAVLIGESVRERFGLNSPIYFNLREPLHTDIDLLWKVGREFALKLCEFSRDSPARQCVVGVPDAATPIALATALYARQNQLLPEISSALLRKEEKAYPGRPSTNWIGPRDSRYEYTLIDDVVASGATKRASAGKMRQEGIRLRRIIVLFDREQGDGLREEGFELHGIFKVSDVLMFYLERGIVSNSDYSKIKEFLSSHRFDSTSIAK